MKAREESILVLARTTHSEAAARAARPYEPWGKPERSVEWKARLELADLPEDVFVRSRGGAVRRPRWSDATRREIGDASHSRD